MKDRRALVRDMAGLFGGALLIHGVALIYYPAGYILAGSMLVAAALLSARAG